MAFTTLEAAVIKQLSNDADIKSFLGSDSKKKIFVASIKPQLFASGRKLLPNISVNVDYGPEAPAIHAMLGTCTIMMEFAEINRNTEVPTFYKRMSLLKENIMNAVHKVDFSTGDLVLNHFNLLSGGQATFLIEDKVWRWPLQFEFVHEDLITKDRVGV